MTRSPRTGWRWLGALTILLMLYAAVEWVATNMSARHGFGSSGGPTLGFVSVVALSVTLRAVLVIAVPAVLAYRLVRWAPTALWPGDRAAPPREGTPRRPDPDGAATDTSNTPPTTSQG